MHIPDGYLAPQTTIPALIAMAPVWAVAFNKVKKKLSEKRIPTLALCAAFSFVIMMFNVPVAGGSSAHAVGAVFIAILLGPWAAVISVSTALLIQALVFGDGGIMAFGFNCFNMAVVMPFTGYFIYKLIAGKSKFGTNRNLAGSFAGSYVGINLAAFCASVEFGIQPLLFKAADGTALYCPYPLSVSIPSMMFAHGVIAGPIDAVITAAAIAYIAKAAPQLFAQDQIAVAGEQKVSFFKRYKAMLIPLGVLVILTPLGLIASGTAWGEWGTDEIKAAVGYIPKGFAAIADKWNALMPDYSLPALGDSTAGSIGGYILSAVVGILLIAGLILLTSVLIKKAQKGKDKSADTEQHGQ
jgi:cobalt/nickel transport system permease protein